jgi:hypothetical protein
MPRIVKWNLKTGNKIGQEDAETKRQEGLAYIEKLKAEEGEKFLGYEENENEFVITLE